MGAGQRSATGVAQRGQRAVELVGVGSFAAAVLRARENAFARDDAVQLDRHCSRQEVVVHKPAIMRVVLIDEL